MKNKVEALEVKNNELKEQKHSREDFMKIDITSDDEYREPIQKQVYLEMKVTTSLNLITDIKLMGSERHDLKNIVSQSIESSSIGIQAILVIC